MSISGSDQAGAREHDLPSPRFPDGPKLELDDLLHQLIGRAQDVVATQGRLRGLLRANQSIAGKLTVPALLRGIVEAARELTHARYGAIGVIAPTGDLEQFVHVGMPDEMVERIGHLPEGKGLLGALTVDPQAIRLKIMADDPRSAGFPTGHPPMAGFLGVPIRIRDEVFGNLYLTEPADGEFSAEDEELVSALAATAGVAIANARLYEEAQRRQDWLQASTEVTQLLLSTNGEEPLRLIARRARHLADADAVTVVLPGADGLTLVVEIADGHGADELLGLTVPVEDSLAELALTTGEPLLLGDIGDDVRYRVHLSAVLPIGPVMVLPLGGPVKMRGALVIGRLRGRHRFGDADLEMATTFAHHAALALELADARIDQQRIVLLEDRDRIARDLHDHVIQRLFAVGLTVQSVAAGLGDDERAERLNRVVTNIDETIRQTRTSIFELAGPLGPETGTLRTRLLDVVAGVSPMLGFEPEVHFTGPVDSVVPESVVGDLVAVLREALTNAARHAHASRVVVEIATTASELSVEISDNGVGIGDAHRRSGLANLRERAEHRGGHLTIATGSLERSTPEQEGTRLRWTIPLR
jgi:signal transduction histidine kinase